MSGDVAERLLELGRRPLPPALDEWSRAALLDTTAALVAGRSADTARAARAFVAHRSGAEWRAFADATAASALDVDDGHDAAGGVHIGSTVVPVLLAVADDRVPLSALRGALVVGYEVGLRAGLIASRAGGVYRASGFAAAIGAAAARVVLDGGRATDLRAAVRVAQAHAPAAELVSIGTRESIGWAAVVGATATELASVFDAERLDEAGALPSGPHLLDHPTLERFDDDLLAPGCYVKPYACCRAAHWALGAVSEIGEVVDPVRIIVTVPAAVAALDERRPRSLGHAQFSLPWLIARAVLQGADALLDLGDSFDDAATLALADRVELRPSTEWEGIAGFPARVEILGADGSRRVSEVVEPPGRALDAVDRERKARSLLGPRSEAVRRLIEGESTVGELRTVLAEGRSA